MFIEAIIAASAAFVVGLGVSAYRAFLSRHVRVARALSRGRRVAIADFRDDELSYYEGHLVEGEEVTVRGLGRWEASPDGDQRGDYRSPPRRLRIVAPLTISDRHARRQRKR